MVTSRYQTCAGTAAGLTLSCGAMQYCSLLPIRPTAAAFGLQMHDTRPTSFHEPCCPFDLVLYRTTALARLNPFFFVPLQEVFQLARALHHGWYRGFAVSDLLQIVVYHPL